MIVKVGLAYTVENVVTDGDTATAYGSGGVDVYATPAMIAMMENASMKAVAAYLDEGYATVGTIVDIKHLSATPVGMKVTTRAELTGVDGNRLTFKVEAYDEGGLIGEGLHERYIVKLDKFLDRVNKKGKK